MECDRTRKLVAAAGVLVFASFLLVPTLVGKQWLESDAAFPEAKYAAELEFKEMRKKLKLQSNRIVELEKGIGNAERSKSFKNLPLLVQLQQAERLQQQAKRIAELEALIQGGGQRLEQQAKRIHGQCHLAVEKPLREWHPMLLQMLKKRDEHVAFEQKVSDANAESLSIFDPVACQQASISFAGVSEGQLRELGKSDKSEASNRKRQLVSIVLQTVAAMVQDGHVEKPKREVDGFKCISDLDGMKLDIFTEAWLYPTLKKIILSRVETSEYLPGQDRSGAFVGSMRHEDLQQTSFSNDSFDIMISSEVLEHIPFPYMAHREIFRFLKPGGAHVFTVPLSVEDGQDIVLSKLLPNGEIRHGPGKPPHLIPPMYHGDPLRKDGILAFTVFSSQMVVKLCQIGYMVDVHQLWDPALGIVGNNAIVFVAWKPNIKGIEPQPVDEPLAPGGA